ncbi:MAG: GMC family oxidoreductase N-terminal domain-containing protein, partial [Gemmatimonadota bacterium]
DDGFLHAARNHGGRRIPRVSGGMGRAPVTVRHYDVAIVGAGAGGGTVAQALAPMIATGKRIVVFEQGPRFRDDEFTGHEVEMARALYAEGGAFLTEDGTMTLAFARGYGGSTIVYTGTSLIAPKRVIEQWRVPGLIYSDLETRSRRYMAENNVHLLPPDLINDNNRLFVLGCANAGYHAEQFPLNLKGCRGSSLCNMGCPNAAKQGTNRVQLPNAERQGVEVVTRAEVRRLGEQRLWVRVGAAMPGEKGATSEWAPGGYEVTAEIVVLSGGTMGTPPLLLRSELPNLPSRVGEGFTCHPAHILVGQHPGPITNDVGHPKSFYLDRGADEGFVLETCMYFPFTTAKNLTGFGPEHSGFMRAFDRLQMILVLACDKATPGNRVSVSQTGEPMVHYTFTPEVIAATVRATRTAARIFFAAGAVRVHAPSANPPVVERSDADRIDELISERHFLPGTISISAAHLMGGSAMGASASDSVTDGWGRVHGRPWLRIADASLFPNAVEINPYLTIMGLADRVAEGVMREWGQGLAPGRSVW